MLAIILSALAFYLYLTDFGRKSIFSAEPRNPKFEIPITYNIGWWSYQDCLTVDSLEVGIVESSLNMFNSKSLISYKVSGKISLVGKTIEEVHISERLNLDTTFHYDRIIEITPVVEDKNKKSSNGWSDRFVFKNEHTIRSGGYGRNRIKFICGTKEQIIELIQQK